MMEQRLIDANKIEYDKTPMSRIPYVLKDSIDSVPTILTIPDNPTNGDMIKALFSDAKIDYHEKSDLVEAYVTIFIKDCDTCQDYTLDWWNAPYKGESEVGNGNMKIPICEDCKILSVNTARGNNK